MKKNIYFDLFWQDLAKGFEETLVEEMETFSQVSLSPPTPSPAGGTFNVNQKLSKR